MINKVFGKCNNHDIVFNYVRGNRWEAVVPKEISGIYYLDLFAEDDAGNVGFLATAVITYDIDNMTFKFELIDYQETYNTNCYDINDTKAIRTFVDAFKYCEFKLEERTDDKCDLFKAK